MASDERYDRDDDGDGDGADHDAGARHYVNLVRIVDPRQLSPSVRLSNVHCHRPMRQHHHRCYCYLPRCSRFYSPMLVAQVMC